MARILIVDDDIVCRRTFGKMARALGYETVEAVDGDDGLRQLATEKGRVDVIVTDYSMPNKDGREFIAELGKSPSSRSIPVVMISGIISENEIIDMVGKGVCRFLKKPLDFSEVTKALRGVTGPEAKLAG